MEFEISDYLKDRVLRRGTCKSDEELVKLEADGAAIYLTYQYFGELFNHYRNNSELQNLVEKRMKFMTTPQMKLSYMLTPRFSNDGFYFNDDKIDILSSIYDIAEKVDSENQEKIVSEMFSYVEEMSTLSDIRKRTVYQLSSKQYWNVIGCDKFPALSKLALPLTEMICSSAIAERTWSTFNFIHSRLRNKLSNDRVEKLVFLYTNCVLLDSIDKNDYIFEEGALMSGNEHEN